MEYYSAVPRKELVCVVIWVKFKVLFWKEWTMKEYILQNSSQMKYVIQNPTYGGRNQKVVAWVREAFSLFFQMVI